MVEQFHVACDIEAFTELEPNALEYEYEPRQVCRDIPSLTALGIT